MRPLTTGVVCTIVTRSITSHLCGRFGRECERGHTRSCRQPGIIKAFEEMWGTDDLIVSFDGMNATLPINKDTGRTDIEPTKPWPRESYSEIRLIRYRPELSRCQPARAVPGYRQLHAERTY